jgi:predicted amidohydrolase
MHAASPILLGVIQTPVCTTARELDPLLDRAATLADGRPSLFALPELFGGGFDYDRSERWQAETPALLERLHAFARAHSLALAGSFWTASPSGPRNALFLLDPERDAPLQAHAKQHLFPLSREERHFAPGQEPPHVVEVLGLRVGWAVCFELRFPELFRWQAAQGADAFLVCSQWPAARQAHLQALVRARAVENQAWVLSCNACGPSALGELAGGSRLISPWGEDAFACGADPEAACAEADPAVLARARQLFDTRASGCYRVLPAPDRGTQEDHD